MNMEILSGKILSQQQLLALKEEISLLTIKPKLAIIQIGDEEPSNVYVSMKRKAGDMVGIEISLYKYNPDTLYSVQDKILELNVDNTIHGIIVQLPTPGSETHEILNLIAPEKDVDGLTSTNLGRIWNGNGIQYLGATPKAVIYALKHIAKRNNQTYEEFIKGKNVLIINHNILIGKPLAGVLLNSDATVTIAHSNTKALQAHLNSADIIITATGQRIIDKSNSQYLKNGVVIIDSGYARKDGLSYGDVDPNSVKEKASWITPVPGGIGPLGVAMLMRNTYDACINSLNTPD